MLDSSAQERFENIAQELAGIFLEKLMTEWGVGPARSERKPIKISLDTIQKKFTLSDVHSSRHGELSDKQKASAARRSKYVEKLVERIFEIIKPVLDEKKINKTVDWRGKEYDGFVDIRINRSKSGMVAEISFALPLTF